MFSGEKQADKIRQLPKRGRAFKTARLVLYSIPAGFSKRGSPRAGEDAATNKLCQCPREKCGESRPTPGEREHCMKMIKRIWKPAAALSLALWLLAAGLATALPGLLAELSDVALRRGGVPAGAPAVLSRQAMTLLQTFSLREDSRLLEESYRTVSPESGEAARLAGTYPAARQSTVCVKKNGLPGETETDLEHIAENAAGAFLEYLLTVKQTGELQRIARRYVEARSTEPGEFKGNLRDDFYEEEPDYEEGVIGKVPEDALFTLPGESGQASEDPGSPEEAGAAPQAGGSPVEQLIQNLIGFDLDRFTGYDSVTAEQLYTALPLIAQTGGKTVEGAVAQAARRDNRAAGLALERLFLEELGVDAARLKNEARFGGAALYAVLGLAALAAAAGGALLAWRWAGQSGKALQEALSPTATVRYAVGETRLLRGFLALAPGLPSGAVLLLGGGVSAALRARGSVPRTVLAAAGGALVLAVLAWGLLGRGALLSDQWVTRAGPRQLLGAQLLPAAVLLAAHLLCGLALVLGRHSALPLGKGAAFALSLLGGLLGSAQLAALLRLLPGAARAARQVEEILEQWEETAR